MAEQEQQPAAEFQPQVEVEEGDPTRADFVIAGLIVLVVVAGILWAMGMINLPH